MNKILAIYIYICFIRGRFAYHIPNKYMVITDLGRYGVSKATLENASLVGTPKLNLAPPRNLARNHKECKLENVRIKN